MKKTKITVAIVALFALGIFISSCGDSANNEPKTNEEVQTAKNDYACPMHPEITGHKGDTCTKCGMDLEPMKATMNDYACPMHPEITGHKGDTCTECGMDLEKMKGEHKMDGMKGDMKEEKHNH